MTRRSRVRFFLVETQCLVVATLLGISFAFAACGRSHDGTTGPSQVNHALELEFSDGKITLGEQSLAPGIKLAELKSTLGLPTKVVRGVLIVNLFENAGLTIYTTPDDKILALRAYLSPWPTWLRASAPFATPVTIDGHEINASTTKEQVAALAGAQPLGDVAGSLFRGTDKQTYARVIAQLGRSGTGYVEFGLGDALAIKHPQDAACDQGDIKACTDVAYAYHASTTLVDGQPRAFEAATKACTGQDNNACLLLAGMMARGEGKPVDRNAAQTLYGLLCGKGIEAACAALPPPPPTPAEAPSAANPSEAALPPPPTALAEPSCAQQHRQVLFDQVLRCARRKTMRAAILKNNGIVKREDDRYYADLYQAASMLDHAKLLVAAYTEDDKLAEITYVFDSAMRSDALSRLVQMLDQKYGPPRDKAGYADVGPFVVNWILDDDIRMQVARENEWQPVYLTYTVPDNYAQMRREMAASEQARSTQDAHRQFGRF